MKTPASPPSRSARHKPPIIVVTTHPVVRAGKVLGLRPQLPANPPPPRPNRGRISLMPAVSRGEFLA